MIEDPNAVKYLIHAYLSANGVVEKPDVIGAIFGQTEGLLNDELDLRELQKSGRIGRIEANIESKKGKSEGEVLIPSSLDKIETAVLAASLEVIDRVGPCKASLKIEQVEDVRAAKRRKIIDRAKTLLSSMTEKSESEGHDIAESVRESMKIEDITSYGSDSCPAGPNVDTSDALIIVEGRSDILNLLKSGIKNTIAVEGTSIPKTVQDLSREKITTAFLDGDRGGDLILKELLQIADIDFIARAPKGREVEELSSKQITKSLRGKMPIEQYVEMYGMDKNGNHKEERSDHGGNGRSHGNGRGAQTRSSPAPSYEERGKRGVVRPMTSQSSKPTAAAAAHSDAKAAEKKADAPAPQTAKKSDLTNYKTMLSDLSGTLKALLLDAGDKTVREIPVRDLAETLKNTSDKIETVVFDGIITQRLLDIAVDKKIKRIVGVKMGNVVKRPSSVEISTRD